MKKSFSQQNPMKDEMININDYKNNEILNQTFIEKIEYKAYFISCFISSIWEKYSYNLISNNKEIISIGDVYKNKIYLNNNEFLAIIHQINFNKNYKSLKTISLKLRSNNENKILDLIDLNFKPDKDIVIFSNLQIKKNSIISIQDNNNEIIEEKNIAYALKESEKLKYFLDYFEKENLMEEEINFKINLAEQFIIHSKQKNIFYSDIIKIFCILYETKKITLLLDNYEYFDYNFDEVTYEEFTKIYELYKNDINLLYKKNCKYFISKKNEKKEEVIKKYKISLENFMMFYDLFYGNSNSKTLENQKITNLIPTISNIVKNKSDLIGLTWFIGKEMKIFSQLFEKEKKIQIESEYNFENEETLINFKMAYVYLISEEELYGFVFDYSKVFYKLINIYNQFEFLIDIKKLYEKEMKKIPNPHFLQEVNDKIHYSGMERINQKSDNNFLIKFIKNNEYYYSKKSKTNEKKDFSILNHFNLFSKDKKFFENYNESKIYSFFEENYVEYLSIFSSKIKHIKYFGYFFKLLPPEMFNKKEINLIYKWLQDYIHTFSVDECPDFKDNIKIFVEAIIMKKLNQVFFDLIRLLKNNIQNYYIELFAFLLNSIQNSPHFLKDNLIKHIIFPIDEEEELNDNIFIFLSNVKQNKSIAKIFLSKIHNFAISKEDFYENNLKFKLFEKLLFMDEYYSLLNEDNNLIYLDNTKYICQTIVNSLKNLELTYQFAKSKFSKLGKNEVVHRISLALKCLNDKEYQKNADLIYSHINKIVSEWTFNTTQIEKVKLFFSYFSKKEYKFIEQLSYFNSSIFNKKLNNLNSEQAHKDFLYYSKYINRAKEGLNLRKSLFFNEIYESLKESANNKNFYEMILKEFNCIKNLFAKNKDQIKAQLKKIKQVKYLVNIGYNNGELLATEIDWLLNYFKITNFEHKDFLITELSLMLENKTLFSEISGILQLYDIYKDILKLDLNDVNKNLYNELYKYKKTLKTFENNSNNEVQNISKNIKEKFGFSKKKELKIISKYFILINQYPESMRFIRDKKLENINNLIEFLSENEDSYLSENDINEFMKVVNFFEKIRNKNNVLFIDFINDIIEGISDKGKCGNSIFKYIEKYNYIQNLFNHYLNNTEGCVKKIRNILEKSKFTILLNKDKNEYEIEGLYRYNKSNKDLEKENDYSYILYEDLKSLFQRVFLANVPDKYKDDINKYINFFKNIKELISIFNQLFEYGYQEKIRMEIDILKSDFICSYKNETINLEEWVKYFNEIKKKVYESLTNCYYKKDVLKLFYGRQLSFIYENIKNKKEQNINNLFKVISNNAIKNLKKFDISFGNFNNEKMYDSIINNISDYFKQQLTSNGKDLNDIYNFNKIQQLVPLQSKKIKSKKNEFKGIYSYISTQQEIDSLNIYKFLTDNLPINSCFLYCNKTTSIGELNAFLLRAVFCESHTLFCMINVNLLNHIQRRKFIILIKKYAKNNGNIMKSCLLIIYSHEDTDLQKILEKIKNINIYQAPMNFINFTFDQKYKISLIDSNNCGLGKSDIIQEKNKKENLNYIYFPIGGKFTRDDLVNRLKKLPDMSDIKQNYSIHLDISQTEEIQLLNEFFFKLLILRKCDLNENAKYFGVNVEIIIEIPNDFKNYSKEFNLLSHISGKTLQNIGKINLSPKLKVVEGIITMYENNDILLKNYVETKELKSEEHYKNKILQYLKTINLENPNYYQINIFIKILANEFIKFSKCEGYNPKILLNNAIASGMSVEKAKKGLELRKFIINSFIQVTKMFLVSPYEKLIKNQKINQELYSSDNKQKYINEILSINIDSSSFDKIKPSLVLFNEDEKSCTIITTCNEKDEEFKNLEKLYYSQGTDFNNFKNDKNKAILYKKKLRNFRDFNSNEIFEQLLSFLNVSGLDETKQKEILGSYVYTPDNFIKVILIRMRLRVKIPVILMGETGCGKTTLIEMVSKLINKGKIYVKKMNIHAGIVDKDIINFFEKINLQIINEDRKELEKKKKEFRNLPEKSRQAYLKNNTEKQIFQSYEDDIKKREIWVFFDELNTCNSMGLLTEILCKNSIYGKPLDKRFIFMASCNPYRISEKKIEDFNVLYKVKKTKNLVYTVNPLPMSLLNFVFNFGALKEKDEYNYIESMISVVVNKIFEKNKNLTNNDKIKLISIETDCVDICQKFMKKNNDISIVSLREVNRFNIMFEFFIEYINQRKNNKELIENLYEEDKVIEYYKSKTDIEILYCALNLSLFVCYYLRLPDKNSRLNLENLINEKNYFKDGFLKVPLMEQNYMINNFEVPKGIAKNRNLKENIFILFICVINKIPLITLGKPGRSKTLSFKILQNSMQGQSSKSIFLRQFPKIIPYKIQGSLNTTSKEILDTFKKARQSQEYNKDKIVVVFMDEMGLAEISENNPLKVMHSELESEETKISFVGISNWFIDASKMNRVIYNVVQDPDEEEVIQTGKEIIKSYEEKGENYSSEYENIIVEMSKAYYEFISTKKNQNDENQYFHGSRDFYSLIKIIINGIIKNKKELEVDNQEIKNEIINKICLDSIERNFGGLDDSVDEFKRLYLKQKLDSINNIKKYDILKCIKENINDKSSRYLLLINDSSLGKELVNSFLEEVNKDKSKCDKATNELDYKEDNKIEIISNNSTKKVDYKKYYSGSKFIYDKNNALYINEILNKIKYQMETDNTLILNDLEIIYPILYELFNQSYTYLDGKKFVYLGESKSLSLVNDNFKVIVLVDKDSLKNQEPPFLSRFEKHIINFSYLLGEESLLLAAEIYSNLSDILNIKLKNNKFEVNKKFKKHMTFINEEEIKGLIYNGIKRFNNFDKEKIIEYVLKKISPCFTEELMILITKYDFRNNNNYYYKIIYNEYKDKYCDNIRNYLEKLNEVTSIVYTYSRIEDEIFNDENGKIMNKFFENEFSQNSINEININSIYSMDQIEKEILDYYANEGNKENKNIKNLLIIKFRQEDMKKFNDIYFLANDLKGKIQINGKSKILIFIIYLSFENTKNYKASFLLNCPQTMIENLDNEYFNFHKIVNSSNDDLIRKKLIDINLLINNNIEKIFKYFSFDLINYEKESYSMYLNNNYKCVIIDEIKENQYLKDYLTECLNILIKDEEDLIVNVFNKEVFNNKKYENKKENINHINFMSLLYEYLTNFVVNNLRKIIYILEKEQIISSAITDRKIIGNNIFREYINEYIYNINNELNSKFILTDKDLNQKITIPIILGKRLPFCENLFKILFNFIQNNYANKYIEVDNSLLRIKIKEENIQNQQEKYINEIKKLENYLKLELNKCKIIKDILNSKNEKLISAFFYDLFYSFISRNNKLKNNYEEISFLLDLLVQLRIKTRLNDNLNIDFIEHDKIELKSSFLDIIKEEEDKKSKKLEKQEGEGEGEGERERERESEKELENEIIIEKKIKVYNNSIYLNQFISIISFLQSYSKEIYMILEMYYFLSENIPSLLVKIKSFIENKTIEMENSNRNPSYSKVNKVCFFYIIESMCKIFKEQLTDSLQEKINSENINFYQSIKFFIENALKLEKKFLLFSKEIFDLEIIVNLINHSQLKQNEEALGLINQTMNYLSSDDKDNLQIINFINIILPRLFGENSKKNARFISKLILNRYKNNYTDEYREKLFEIVFDNKMPIFNNNLIEYSFPLIYSLFNFSKMSKKKDFFSLIKDDKNTRKINNINNQKVNELILYRFEIVFENHFKKIINDTNNNNLYKKLLSRDNLEEATKFLYKNENNNQTDLLYIKTIYCIAYIKRYLFYFVDSILKEEGFQKLFERESVQKTLFGVNKQQKIVEYYYLKLILKSWKNWEKMENLDNKGKAIINEDFTTEIDSEKKDYQFLLLDLKNEKLYTFLEQLIKNKFNDVNKEIFRDILLKNYNYLFTFLSNLLLISKYSYIKEKRDENNLNYFDNLLKSIIDYINQDKINENINKNIVLFLNKIFKDSIFKEKILPKITLDISAKDKNREKAKKIRILLFALRFVFSVLIKQLENLGNKNLFYNNLLSKNISSTLDNYFIPGNFPIEDVDNNSLKGLKSVDKNIFKKNDNKVREMSGITYRLLNFILYSFIFYSNIEGFIKDKNMTKYEVESMTCFDILENNWEFLEQTLTYKIELFLNIIFNSIIEKLNKAENFINKSDQINFEKEIDEIINKALSDIKIKQNFEEKNYNIVNIIPYFSKTIIEEKYKSELYPEDIYPNLNYFYISEMPSNKDFIEKFKLENKEEYPILDIIINNEAFRKKTDFLSYLPNLNKICNYMINFCSLKFSRDDSNKLKVREIITNKDLLDLLDEFKKEYKELLIYLNKEEQFDVEKELLEFKDDLFLSDLCPDISEEKIYGSILLSIYKKMVEWQNSFINQVINSKNEELNCYKGLFESKIMIQDCDEDQIIKLPKLNIDFKENKNNDDNFLYDLIIDNSYRKENKIIYNFDEIEEQLASHILLNIKSFKSEFRTVTYQYESFTGKRSGIIARFINKYQQRKLTDKELEHIRDCINRQEYDYNKLYFSLQGIIDIILDYNYESNETIYSIFEIFNRSYEFESIKNFFDYIKEINLTIECLIDLMDLIELNFWKIIKNNVNSFYQKDIDENIRKQFCKYLEENYFEKNSFKITKNDLCSAIRKYITRYLYGKSDKNINLQMDIKNNLINIELWPINYDIKIIEEEINKIFEGTKIEISQALKLFYFLENTNLVEKEENKEKEKEEEKEEEEEIEEIEEKEEEEEEFDEIDYNK